MYIMHLRAVSSCLYDVVYVYVCVRVRVCVHASWEAGAGNDDEQTLQGKIISHYPEFPDATMRG